MTTTELIKMLKDNELGGISGRPRVLSITLEDGTFIAEPEIMICSSGDGISGPELDLLIKGGRKYSQGTELKPCPFCGAKTNIKRIDGKTIIYFPEARHKTGCQLQFCAYIDQPTTKRAAIKKWNRRADND